MNMKLLDLLFRGLFIPTMCLWSARRLFQEVRDLIRGEISPGELVDREVWRPGVRW